ncbi:MAG: tetratricopeptide repeat protein [Anaerolineae bacterium]|nr:tetratricopeptide repeat protein [Anaerolineae bacterium]
MVKHDPIAAIIAESLALKRSGRISAALRHAQKAVQLAQSLKDPRRIATALNALARVYIRLGHYNSARELAEEALAHASSGSHAHVDALLVLGICAAETDDPDAAERFYHQAVDLSRQLGYDRALLRGLHNLAAGVYIPRGRFELALAADEEAYRLALSQEAPELAWITLASRGWVYWVIGQYAQAQKMATELRRVASPGSLAEGFYYCLCADLAQEETDPNDALPLYAKARSIAESIGDPGLNVLLRLGLSRYERKAGNAAAARDWANDALAIARRVSYKHLQGTALIERGRALWAMGDLDAAEQDLRDAIALMDPLRLAFDLARAALLLAALLHAQQRADEAIITWVDAARRIVSGGYAFLLEQERALAFPLVAAYLKHEDQTIADLSTTLLTHLQFVPPPPLRVRTLGGFEVWQGRRLIDSRLWGRRRAGELFRLLLVSPGYTLSRDQVIEALWPGRTSSSVSALFHHATSALRRALEPELPDKFPSRYLDVEEGRVTLRLPPGSTIDFVTFERHVEQGAYGAAVALYQGDLLPADRYADWAIPLRERLAQLYLRSLLHIAQDALSTGCAQRALDACHTILAREPWQEQAVLLGMRACMALGDRAGALRLYVALERCLREELGIAPVQELQALYQALKDQP